VSNVATSDRPVPDILVRRHDDYVHIVVETVLVDRRFMDDLIDVLDRAFPDFPFRSYRLLLEIGGASETKLDLIAALEVWYRAAEKGLEQVRIAYVVRSRPVHPIAKLIETVSQARHVRLRFFGDSDAALEWLRAA
jgi:hypothetical protein